MLRLERKEVPSLYKTIVSLEQSITLKWSPEVELCLQRDGGKAGNVQYLGKCTDTASVTTIQLFHRVRKKVTKHARAVHKVKWLNTQPYCHMLTPNVPPSALHH